MTGEDLMRSRPLPMRAQQGFTLLELLISITMLGIILVIIISATRLGYRSVEAGEAKISSLERLRTSLSLINSQIQSQTPLMYEDNGEQKVFFTGSRDSVRFASIYSLWGSRKGNVYVRYSVGTDSRGKLFLKATENLVANGNEAETLLFDDLDACFFSYFFQDPTEESGSWVEEWTDTLRLPEKMRISLTRLEREFTFIIPLRAHEPKQSVVVSPLQQNQGKGFMGPF